MRRAALSADRQSGLTSRVTTPLSFYLTSATDFCNLFNCIAVKVGDRKVRPGRSYVENPFSPVFLSFHFFFYFFFSSSLSSSLSTLARRGSFLPFSLLSSHFLSGVSQRPE